MLRTLGAQIKEFKKDSVLTPVFMIGEVIMETIIPLLMASIIDNGVNGNNGSGDMNHIYLIGFLMIVVALASLTFGILGAGTAPGRRRALQGTCAGPCMRGSRHSVFPILTNSALLVW